MQYEEIRCRVCGGNMLERQKDGTYVCKHCRAHFRENDLEEYKETIRGELRGVVTEALVMQRAQDIANIRRNLFEAIQEEYTDSYKIVGYCRDLKKLLPNDFQAKCFEVLNNGRKREINAMLESVDERGEGRFYVKDILDFMVKSLTPANLLPLKSLVERALKDSEKTKYLNKIEEEARKNDEGLYSPEVPRKAFIAYSSEDMAVVTPLVEYLEDMGITCYVEWKNMRHIQRSREDYNNILERAMHNCENFVFVSTRNSRRFGFNEIENEIPYIRDHEPKVNRIEYLVEDYGVNESAAKKFLRSFFGESKGVDNQEDLLFRIKSVKLEEPFSPASVKYCLSCGAKNVMTANFCSRCKNREFGTQEEYEVQQRWLTLRDIEQNDGMKSIPLKGKGENGGGHESVVCITYDGRIKCISKDDYVQLKQEFISKPKPNCIVKTMMPIVLGQTVLVFTDCGNCYRLRTKFAACKFSEGGYALDELFEDAQAGELPVALFPADTKEGHVLFFTRGGMVKRTAWSEYAVNKPVFQAIRLNEDDRVIGVETDTEEREETIFFVTKLGMCLNARKEDIPSQGRIAGGVRGINLNEGDKVIFASQIDGEGEVVVAITGGRIKRIIVAQVDPLPRYRKGIQIAVLKEGEEVLFASYVTIPYMLGLALEDGLVAISTEDVPIDATGTRGRVNKAYASLSAVYAAKYLKGE